MKECPNCGGFGRILCHKHSGDWVMVCKTLTGEGCGYESALDEDAIELRKVVENSTFYKPEEWLEIMTQHYFNPVLH